MKASDTPNIDRIKKYLVSTTHLPEAVISAETRTVRGAIVEYDIKLDQATRIIQAVKKHPYLPTSLAEQIQWMEDHPEQA